MSQRRCNKTAREQRLACLFACRLCNLHCLKLNTDGLDVCYLCVWLPDYVVQLLKMSVHIPFVKHHHSSTKCFRNAQWIFPELHLCSYETSLFQLLFSLCYCFFWSHSRIGVGTVCKFYPSICSLLRTDFHLLLVLLNTSPSGFCTSQKWGVTFLIAVVF